MYILPNWVFVILHFMHWIELLISALSLCETAWMYDYLMEENKIFFVCVEYYHKPEWEFTFFFIHKNLSFEAKYKYKRAGFYQGMHLSVVNDSCWRHVSKDKPAELEWQDTAHLHRGFQTDKTQVFRQDVLTDHLLLRYKGYFTGLENKLLEETKMCSSQDWRCALKLYLSNDTFFWRKTQYILPDLLSFR